MSHRDNNDPVGTSTSHVSQQRQQKMLAPYHMEDSKLILVPVFGLTNLRCGGHLGVNKMIE